MFKKQKTKLHPPQKNPKNTIIFGDARRDIFLIRRGWGCSGELLYPSIMVDIFDIKISCTQGTEVCRYNHDRQKHILINVKREH